MNNIYIYIDILILFFFNIMSLIRIIFKLFSRLGLVNSFDIYNICIESGNERMW